MPPIVIAGGLAAAGTIAGSVMGANAQKKAAKTASNTAQNVANQNNALAREQYGLNAQRLDPIWQDGRLATSAINSLLGLGGTQQTAPQAAPVAAPMQYGAPVAVDQGREALGGMPSYKQNQLMALGALHQPAMTVQPQQAPQQAVPQQPGQTGQEGFRNFIANSDYAFSFGEGANALNTGYAAQGALQSGAAMKALEKYRQNLQSGYRGEYMDRLAQQQGVGLGAASALAGVGQNMVGQVSANNNNAGSAAANAALMGGVAQSNMYAGIGGALGNLAGQTFGSSFGSRPQSHFGMYPASQTSAPW